MKKCLVFAVATILLAGGAFAQEKQDGLKKTKPQPLGSGREAEIWDGFNDRLANQVDSWFKDGEFIKVIQIIKLQYEIYPKSYEIATNLGWMHENVEQNPEALTVYKRYPAENPSDPDNMMPLAQFYFLKRKYSDAVLALVPAVGKKPGQHPNMYRMLARSYEMLKKYKEAIGVWDSYIKLAPTDLQAKANLDRVKKKMAG